MTTKNRPEMFADYNTASFVEVSGIKRTAIPTTGLWFVRHMDGDSVFVARSMFVGQDEWIEVCCDRIISVRHRDVFNKAA